LKSGRADVIAEKFARGATLSPAMRATAIIIGR